MHHTNDQLLLKVAGMTCHSCETRVEKAVAKVEGVLEAKADQAHGRVSVTIDPEKLNPEQAMVSVSLAINQAGYLVKGHASGAQRPAMAVILVIAAGMIAAFLLINAQGWFNFLPKIDSSIGLAMIFVAGLLTSVHCVAMCGGIALSQQARIPDGEIAENPESRSARVKSALRGLQYHLGRIVSYTILGGIVGAIGSVISFSPTTKGILAGIAGLFMVGIGLRMLGLLPRLTNLRLPRLQRFISPKIFTALRSRGPFFVGILNGFMPCGPLQTMQLYALGTGSAALGALSMFLFSAGTVPLMFAFGAMSSFFTIKWQHRLVRASAILVVFFGVVMAGRALDLSGASGMIQTVASRITGGAIGGLPVGGANVGVSGGNGSGGSVANGAIASIKDGIQYVSFDLQPGSYSPITVQKGIPVRWTINATDDNLNGCNGEIQVPQLNLRKKLAVGANVIEFTPDSSGIISYTCWMGMIHSSIRVVDDLGGNNGVVANSAPPGAGNAASGSFCGVGSATAFAGGKIPTDQIEKAQFLTEKGQRIQEVIITVDDKGYSPAVLVVQKGVPTRIKFIGAKLSACNSSVSFPDYGGVLDLGAGQLATPLIPVEKDFTFQCGMNMLHGYVRVVDDLAKVNLAEVSATVTAWKPKSGSGGMSCCGG